MDINELMHRAFSTCIVMDNKVQFLSTFTKEELIAIYGQFSKDLLDYNIPHYRVVGIYYMSGLGGSTSVLRPHEGYSQSIIELSYKAANIIPGEIGGNNPDEGCVLSTKESEERKAAELEVIDIGVPHCLRRNCSEFGQLEADHMVTEEMTQSSLNWLQYYLGDGTDDPNLRKPNYLLDDFTISKVTRVGSASKTVFFYRKGTGIIDFDDNAQLFTLESDIFPCRTIYDLSSVFLIKYPTIEENYLTLMLKQNINERVLETILRDYGGTFNVD